MNINLNGNIHSNGQSQLLMAALSKTQQNHIGLEQQKTILVLDTQKNPSIRVKNILTLHRITHLYFRKQQDVFLNRMKSIYSRVIRDKHLKVMEWNVFNMKNYMRDWLAARNTTVTSCFLGNAAIMSEIQKQNKDVCYSPGG